MRKKICITEAELLDYPGMYLCGDSISTTLSGIYAPYPKTIRQEGHNNLEMRVVEHDNYLAKINGATDFPWRIIIIAENDIELADNDMVYKISTPPTGNFDWVVPGKVAWEWWNMWNIDGVDFKSGINNKTYKYYIDFASKHGIEYVILDEGWAVNLQADLMQIVPEINLPMLIKYAKERNVGIILWAGYWAFERDMENICRHYATMGIKGFKIDFMNRDDQIMVNFHHRAAQMGAKYKLLIDFHGTYKPTGLHRSYPNVIDYEGVNGLEQMKWSNALDQILYDVTIPFVRQVAGPMDYTQGAMRNASKENYRAIYSEPMSQGTRCHQLALYVVLDSPLNMLCDSPTNYLKELECTDFIVQVPTVWDETHILQGQVGEFIITARRCGQTWYIGGITNWTERDIEIDLSFLDEREHMVTLFRDGVNADRKASDYKKEVFYISRHEPLKVHLSLGGGFAAKIE